MFILHPHKKVSSMQQKQMTTVNEDNIFNLAIDGNFDDCQKIVKELFVDDDIQNKTSQQLLIQLIGKINSPSCLLFLEPPTNKK